MKKLFRFAGVITVVILINGCLSITKHIPFYPVNNNNIKTISVESTADSNENVPVSLDMVFIYTTKAESELNKLLGPEWFKNKNALLLRYKNDLKIVHLEVVPHTQVTEVILPDDYNEALKVILFANYIAEDGQYQADISTYKNLRIVLGSRFYTLEEQSE